MTQPQIDPIASWATEAIAHRQRVSGKLPLQPMDAPTFWSLRSVGFAVFAAVMVIGGIAMALG